MHVTLKLQEVPQTQHLQVSETPAFSRRKTLTVLKRSSILLVEGAPLLHSTTL